MNNITKYAVGQKSEEKVYVIEQLILDMAKSVTTITQFTYQMTMLQRLLWQKVKLLNARE